MTFTSPAAVSPLSWLVPETSAFQESLDLNPLKEQLVEPFSLTSSSFGIVITACKPDFVTYDPGSRYTCKVPPSVCALIRLTMLSSAVMEHTNFSEWVISTVKAP